MNFAIKITYTDDKVLDIVLPESDVSRFIETVRKGECYWDETKQAAFWTKDGLIRYMNLNKIVEPPKTDIEPPNVDEVDIIQEIEGEAPKEV